MGYRSVSAVREGGVTSKCSFPTLAPTHETGRKDLLWPLFIPPYLNSGTKLGCNP